MDTLEVIYVAVVANEVSFPSVPLLPFTMISYVNLRYSFYWNMASRHWMFGAQIFRHTYRTGHSTLEDEAARVPVKGHPVAQCHIRQEWRRQP